MTSYFIKWSKNYEEYIDLWYDKFCILFEEHSLQSPTRRDFYHYCYINTRSYYSPEEGKKVPTIR